MTANLHVALAMALGRSTSESDAALIDQVYRLTRHTEPTLERNLRSEPARPKVTAQPSPQLELEDVA